MGEMPSNDSDFESPHASAATAASILVRDGTITMEEAQGVIKRGRGIIRWTETALMNFDDGRGFGLISEGGVQ